MCSSCDPGQSVVRCGLVVFEGGAFRGEAKGIMYPSRPLPLLAAFHRSRNEDSSCREKGHIRRTQSTERAYGPIDRRKHSQKFTKAHSGSTGLRIAADEPLAVYFQPRAFEDLGELEGEA